MQGSGCRCISQGWALHSLLFLAFCLLMAFYDSFHPAIKGSFFDEGGATLVCVYEDGFRMEAEIMHALLLYLQCSPQRS